MLAPVVLADALSLGLLCVRLLETDHKVLRSVNGSRRNSGSSLVSSSSASSNLSHLEEDTWILWGRIVNEWEEVRKKKDKQLRVRAARTRTDAHARKDAHGKTLACRRHAHIHVSIRDHTGGHTWSHTWSHTRSHTQSHTRSQTWSHTWIHTPSAQGKTVIQTDRQTDTHAHAWAQTHRLAQWHADRQMNMFSLPFFMRHKFANACTKVKHACMNMRSTHIHKHHVVCARTHSL